jgi:hypothetical protein
MRCEYPERSIKKIESSKRKHKAPKQATANEEKIRGERERKKKEKQDYHERLRANPYSPFSYNL